MTAAKKGDDLMIHLREGGEVMEDQPMPAGLPVCILAAAGDDKPDVVCVRIRCPGAIEMMFAIEGGVASATYHGSSRIETMEDVPVDARTVAEMVGEAADGALLVVWDLDRAATQLRAYHPAPEQILARSQFDLELRAAAALLGIIDGNVNPTIEQLASLLSITPPTEEAREQAWFLVRVVRRLAASGTWLSRVLALGFDERSILGTCVDRLAAGKQAYGNWKLDDDRDYAREAYEEVIDGLHYAAAGLLRIQDQARKKGVG